jgi:RNase adaptor protein for sRNA GlmZ degradation
VKFTLACSPPDTYRTSASQADGCSLRQAVRLIENQAFDLADRLPPELVSQLIETAAELDRLAGHINVLLSST